MRVIDHREVRRLAALGAQIVDALPEHEYRAAHIAGAIHLPLARLWADARAKLTRNPIVTYCRDAL